MGGKVLGLFSFFSFGSWTPLGAPPGSTLQPWDPDGGEWAPRHGGGWGTHPALWGCFPSESSCGMKDSLSGC